MSIGIVLLVIATLIPGAGPGAAVALGLAGCSVVVGPVRRGGVVLSGVFASAAVGLGDQSAWQASIAGMLMTLAIGVRFDVLPRAVIGPAVVGAVFGTAAAAIPLSVPWLVVVAPVLVVLLIVLALGPVMSSVPATSQIRG